MDPWKAAKAGLTLGGSYRLDKANDRYQVCVGQYESLLSLISACNGQIEALTYKLKQSISRSKKRLRLANKMLAPRCLRTLAIGQGTETGIPISHAIHQYPHFEKGAPSWRSTPLALSGVALGTSTAILAWQGAQIVGIASTGTAMLGLHGAAATNAGWALFGGGSLATGGGGMALGHLILPGVGLAVAIGVGAVSTHREANKVGKVCEQIDIVNSQNSQILSLVESNLQRLQNAESIYVFTDTELCFAVKTARLRLRRFGFLSVLYRYVRFKISGVYYTEDEWLYVERLDEAVRKFFSSMIVLKDG
jgi:hypothetical protein